MARCEGVYQPGRWPAGGALPSPKRLHVIRNGKLTSQDWDGKPPVVVPRDGVAILSGESTR